MRFFVSTTAGIMMGVLLFLLMSALISETGGFIRDTQSTNLLEFVRIHRDETAKLIDRRRPEEPTPIDKPPPPKIEITDDVEQPTREFDIDFPEIDITGTGGGLPGGPWSRGSRLSEGGVVCVVCISPQYPSNALGKEGWVELEFTVTRAGTVTDAVVVDAEPNRVFNRSALRAIYRSKFKPRVVDGVATEQRARQRYQFVMEPSD